MFSRRMAKLFSAQFPSDWDVRVHHVGVAAMLAVFLSAVLDKLSLTDALPNWLKVGVFAIFVAVFSLCVVYLILRAAYVLLVSCCRWTFSKVRSAVRHIACLGMPNRRPPSSERSEGPK